MFPRGLILLLLASCGAAARAEAPRHVYVSGYAPTISVARWDPGSGALALGGSVRAGTAPSFMAFAPSGRFAYALDEVDADAIISYAVDGASGALRELGREPAGGKGAAHLAVHPSGRWIATAHYDSDSVTIHELGRDGLAGAQTDARGGCRAAHQTVFAQQGSVAFVSCLMSDEVLQFRFTAGKLTPLDPPRLPVPGNPRHLALDPAERHAYILSERENLITTCDLAGGKLTHPRTVSSVPPGGRHGEAGEIAIHPSGKFLYASNRNDDSIAVFTIGAGGDLSAAGWQHSECVRHFTLDPTGGYLLAANQKANRLAVFKVDRTTGKLSPLGAPLPVPEGPAFVGFPAR
jgi:6-phosphogluconolactonase